LSADFLDQPLAYEFADHLVGNTAFELGAKFEGAVRAL
jgi:hypothetical protein